MLITTRYLSTMVLRHHFENPYLDVEDRSGIGKHLLYKVFATVTRACQCVCVCAKHFICGWDFVFICDRNPICLSLSLKRESKVEVNDDQGVIDDDEKEEEQGQEGGVEEEEEEEQGG